MAMRCAASSNSARTRLRISSGVTRALGQQTFSAATVRCARSRIGTESERNPISNPKFAGKICLSY